MAQFGTYLDFYMFLRGNLKDSNRLHRSILDSVALEVSPSDSKTILDYVRSFTCRLNSKWIESARHQKTFMTRYRAWLETAIQWPTSLSVELQEALRLPGEDFEREDQHSLEPMLPEETTSGRTRKPFADLSNKQKRRRTESLSELDEDEILFTLLQRLKSNGKNDLADVIDHLAKDPLKLPAVKSLLFDKGPKPVLPEDRSLALVAALDLSKWKYSTLRSILLDSVGTPLFMPYGKLLEAKKMYYPKPEDVTVTEDGASVKLQALLDLTVNSVLRVVGDKCPTNGSLKLISKWGFDGSSSQSVYKQVCESDIYESSVFMTSLVPLRLVSDGCIVWENPSPSSTLYCRPVKFQFAKESVDYVRLEDAKMKEEIRNLIVSVCGEFQVQHELHMTMIDGKVATIVSGTPSSATCSVCLLTPSKLNDLSLVKKKPIREQVLQLGLSVLHMWIRCMECLLHISYNLDFQKWSASGENKKLKEARKAQIQAEFRKVGLQIDVVKQGYGTSNDGNTARRFFRDYEKTASILGIDEDLIKHFTVILQVISCGSAIDFDKFRTYCWNTATLYVDLYGWYYMPASVHKLLIHGADICEHFSCLPIGILSEEAAEARNKDFRNSRQRHARKIGRKQSNEDVLHHLLLTSDPYLSHIRPKCSAYVKMDLLPEAVDLLVEAIDLDDI